MSFEAPSTAMLGPRRRVQVAIEKAFQQKVSVGIPQLVMWEAAGAVLDALLVPAVSADLDHLIRQARMPRIPPSPELLRE